MEGSLKSPATIYHLMCQHADYEAERVSLSVYQWAVGFGDVMCQQIYQ